MLMIFFLQVIRNSKTVITNLRKSKYLGLNLCYQEDEITIYQKVYIKNLERVNVERHLRQFTRTAIKQYQRCTETKSRPIAMGL